MIAAPESKMHRWIFAAILLLAAAVRIWGIDFGTPRSQCAPDEFPPMTCALSFFSGNFNPRWFNYPTLYAYICFGAQALVYGFGRIGGRYADLTDFLAHATADPQPILLIDRGVALAFALAGVWGVYRLGKEIGGRRVGLASALFLSLAFIHVRQSHFGLTDIPADTFMIFSTLALLRLARRGRLRDYVFVGLFAGLAAATKYYGAFMALPVCVLHFWRGAVDRRRIAHMALDRRLWICALVMIATFIAGTPYVIKEWRLVREALQLESDAVKGGFYEPDLGRAWIWHLRFTFPIGLGTPLCIAGAAGLIALFVRMPRRATALAGFAITYYALTGRGHAVFMRYALPCVPALCVAAAWGTVLAADICFPRAARRRANVVFSCVLAALLIVPTATSVWNFDRLLARDDTRELVERWFEQNAAEGASINQTHPPFADIYFRASPEIAADWVRLRPFDDAVKAAVVERVAAKYRDLGLKSFERWDYDGANQCFRFGPHERRTLPEYVVAMTSPFKTVTDANDPTRIPGSGYRPVASFTATTSRTSLFDWQYAFYLPVGRWDGVERPGPNVVIYRREK